ncbi:hypothetical protein BER30_003640 [Clostridioides difficile]|nr:DUF3784 domain-containing protein [Clostridioides difficile]OMK23907.1 hypothetical protein BER30_003640 [Clostridioides difficile]
MDFTCIFFGILFTLAGFWLAFGKGYRHLSLWKNMPQEEKDKINIVPLCRNVGEMIALNGIIFLMKGFLPGFFKPLVCICNNRMADCCRL